MLGRAGKISFFPIASSPLVRIVADAVHCRSLRTAEASNAVSETAERAQQGTQLFRAPGTLGTGEAGLPKDACCSSLEQSIHLMEDWAGNHDLMKGCEVNGPRLRVALLLSGGVDSSTALALLKAAGHEVHAFYLQIWFQEDFRNFWDNCPWEEDISYAHKVCNLLDIHLEVVPLTKEYWSHVVNLSISEIKRGRTPNPDMLCNSQIKFGAFIEFLRQQRLGFDRIATGHYAKLVRFKHQEHVKLAVTPDTIKDQTYFLARLGQDQLASAMFPLGGMTKPMVRELAEVAGLATSSRKDSQGICFLGKVKFNEFVKEHLGEWPGLLLEEETGKQLGLHRGFWFHTIGQRTGLLLGGGPWYVVRKDIDWNVVYVSRDYNALGFERSAFGCSSIQWIDGPPDWSKDLYCKVRHGPQMYRCRLTMKGDEEGLVEIEGQDQGVASGQYTVFYQDGFCLGSGITESRQD